MPTKEWIERNKDKILEDRRKWRKKNREKINAYMREWKAKNKDKVAASHEKRRDAHNEHQREYYQTYYEENREEILERGREYYRKTIKGQRQRAKKYHEVNRDRINSYAKEYKKSNPDQVRKDNHVRRARKLGAESEPWTHEEIAAQGTGFCPYCGKEIGLLYNSKVMHIDHIIPLTKEGATDLKENLEPVCCECNLLKGSKTKEEFLVWKETI